MLIIAAVTICLSKLKPLVQVLSKAKFADVVDPLPSRTIVAKRCDASASRVKSNLEEFILQCRVGGSRRFDRSGSGKSFIAAGRNFIRKKCTAVKFNNARKRTRERGVTRKPLP